jgi:hypothetical protein
MTIQSFLQQTLPGGQGQGHGGNRWASVQALQVGNANFTEKCSVGTPVFGKTWRGETKIKSKADLVKPNLNYFVSLLGRDLQRAGVIPTAVVLIWNVPKGQCAEGLVPSLCHSWEVMDTLRSGLEKGLGLWLATSGVGPQSLPFAVGFPGCHKVNGFIPLYAACMTCCLVTVSPTPGANQPGTELPKLWAKISLLYL